MDIFTQRKTLITTVIVLVAINLISIGFFIWKDNKSDHRIPNEPDANQIKAILKEKLKLTEKQSNEMSAIRLNFFNQEKALSKIIRAERDSMNEIMFNENTDEDLIKSLARNVSNNEYKMEMLRFSQAKELKTICTKEQLNEFETMVKEIRDYFKPLK